MSEEVLKGRKETSRITSLWFVRSAGVLLGIAGVAKVWSGLGSARLLAISDPIIGIPYGHLLLVAGLLETTVALVGLFSRRQVLTIGIMAWTATILLAYRLALVWIGYHKPCGCLGNLTDALHIPPKVADSIMKIILGYLLIGSYASLFWLWQQRKQVSVVDAE